MASSTMRSWVLAVVTSVGCMMQPSEEQVTATVSDAAKSAKILDRVTETAGPYNLVLVRKTLKRTSRPRRVTLRPRIALLGPRRKLRVRIRVTATDAAGNVRKVRRTIKARR